MSIREWFDHARSPSPCGGSTDPNKRSSVQNGIPGIFIPPVTFFISSSAILRPSSIACFTPARTRSSSISTSSGSTTEGSILMESTSPAPLGGHDHFAAAGARLDRLLGEFRSAFRRALPACAGLAGAFFGCSFGGSLDFAREDFEGFLDQRIVFEFFRRVLGLFLGVPQTSVAPRRRSRGCVRESAGRRFGKMLADLQTKITFLPSASLSFASASLRPASPTTDRSSPANEGRNVNEHTVLIRLPQRSPSSASEI